VGRRGSSGSRGPSRGRGRRPSLAATTNTCSTSSSSRGGSACSCIPRPAPPRYRHRSSASGMGRGRSGRITCIPCALLAHARGAAAWRACCGRRSRWGVGGGCIPRIAAALLADRGRCCCCSCWRRCAGPLPRRRWGAAGRVAASCGSRSSRRRLGRLLLRRRRRRLQLRGPAIERALVGHRLCDDVLALLLRWLNSLLAGDECSDGVRDAPEGLDALGEGVCEAREDAERVLRHRVSRVGAAHRAGGRGRNVNSFADTSTHSRAVHNYSNTNTTRRTR
jgi:hypothetical protein